MLMLLLACNRTDVHFIDPLHNEARAQIQVEPEFLDYSGLQLGEEQRQLVQIRNVGDDALSVSPLQISGSRSFELEEGGSGALLEPGASLPVVLHYTAGPEPEAEASLMIRSSDAAAPLLEVPLWGQSLIPILEVSPMDVDFGILGRGESAERILHLRNLGEGILNVDPLGIPLLPFVVEENTGWTIPPGAERRVSLSVSADSPAAFTSSLQVESNDPAGWQEVGLHARVADRPIAVCSADPVEFVAVFEESVFDGTASYDPLGLSITRYEWSLLSQPQGSSATLDSPRVARSSFHADLVGSYVAQLVVYNEAGVSSEPCEVEVEAGPGADLWVEMYWALPNDDMDLHVLAPGGSLTSFQDCYYANCRTGLDWGVSGDISDNPYLDIDDILGTGPENINISLPDAGVYTVYVHDYSGTINNNSNDVTVKIYVGGSLTWTDTRAVTAENSYNAFATISIPDGTVSSL
jgi:hypothetical protein